MLTEVNCRERVFTFSVKFFPEEIVVWMRWAFLFEVDCMPLNDSRCVITCVISHKSLFVWVRC